MTLPTAVRPVRVTLAHESDLVTEGFRALVAPHDDLVLVPNGPGGGLATFVDLTLYDAFAELPLREDALQRLATRPAGGHLVVYSWHLPPDLVAMALAHGAAGCLSKQLAAEDLVDGLLAVARGETVVRAPATGRRHELERARLTPRELEVVGLIGAGLSNMAIAEVTALSVNSIKSYIRGAYRKIQVESRSQAVLWAVRNGCVAIPVAPDRAPPAEAGPAGVMRDARGPAA